MVEEAAPSPNVWKKVREHCGAKGLPLRGVRMTIEG